MSGGLLAHGIGGLRDLPVPTWLFSYGGAIVLVLSFAALGALWRTPRLEGAGEGRPLPDAVQRVLLSPVLGGLLKTASALLLGFMLVAAIFGDRSSATNIVPTFVWVIFWLGLVPVVVLFGDVWRVLNPWKAVADAVAALVGGRLAYTPWQYPERLGRWPAAVVLFAFAAFELAYLEPSDPLMLAIAILLYSAISWYGMFLFGRETWLRHGDAFSVYFEFLSRISLFAVEHDEDGSRRVVVRRPLTGLASRDALPGTLAFVAVMLGSVGFDGLSRTSFWQDARYEALTSGVGDTAAILLNTIGLLGMIGGVAFAYAVAVRIAARVAGTEHSLEGVFVWSLIPIALAYLVAHYFSLFILQGQYVLPLASDPLGRGWDLFGTADYRANLTLLSPNTVWYVQVVALVAGHVLGLVLAHDRALVRFRSGRKALRSQYAMLTLMVVYTVGGLWLLSQG